MKGGFQTVMKTNNLRLTNSSVLLMLWQGTMGLLPDTENCEVRMRRECRERFPRHRSLAIPTCITASAWRMPGSLTSGFLWSLWRGKRYRHSRRMRNPRFCISGKRPIGGCILIESSICPGWNELKVTTTSSFSLSYLWFNNQWPLQYNPRIMLAFSVVYSGWVHDKTIYCALVGIIVSTSTAFFHRVGFPASALCCVQVPADLPMIFKDCVSDTGAAVSFIAQVTIKQWG